MPNDKKPHANLNDSTSNQKGNPCKTYIVRAAIYTRTARVDQSDSYIEQVKRCSEYITQKGWTLCDLFFDEGVSGLAIERPDLSLMIEKAAKHCFDVIVVSSMDRLTRSSEELVEVMSLLRDFRVALQSVNEPEMTSLGLNEFSLKFS